MKHDGCWWTVDCFVLKKSDIFPFDFVHTGRNVSKEPRNVLAHRTLFVVCRCVIYFLSCGFFFFHPLFKTLRKLIAQNKHTHTHTHTHKHMRLSFRRLGSSGNRGVSAGANWISTFRYGFEGSPVFGCYQELVNQNAGSSSSASSSSLSSNGSSRGGDALQRYVYCKALVYASCGGRLARDWIAGCASLSVSDAELVALALQHDASKDDLVRLQMLLEKRRALGERNDATSGGDIADKSTTTTTTSSGTVGGVTSPIPDFFPAGFRTPSLSALSPGTNHPDDEDTLTLDNLTPLTRGMADTILRCFVYDAVKAASFHTTSLLPEQVLHLEHVCATLGLASTTTQSESVSQSALTGKHPKAAASPQVTPINFLQSVIDVVIEENAIMKEKFRVIEQQGSRL
jgi:hypothetical protein